jgi:NTE family protein
MATALMLGGGAPTLTLQSGALAAMDEAGATFDAVSTAGAGMLVGLLYAAPMGISRQQALANTREMGVHDLIYDLLPINYKVFHKPGSAAAAWRLYQQSLPRLIMHDYPMSRFWSDWTALMFSAFSPSDLSPFSLGLCDHAPWIEEVVDFDKLKAFPAEFYMNAYCLDDQEMALFSKEEITGGHFRAALAFPLIYPPFKLNGKTYIEGSAIDTLCFEGLLEYRKRRLEREKAGETRTRKLARQRPLTDVVIFDVLSSKDIIRPPRSLYDAWVQSIMIPLVEIAKDDVALFEARHKGKWPIELHRISFDVPKHYWPKALDWSYSNLATLYDLGYEAGRRFCRDPRHAFLFEEAKKNEAEDAAEQVLSAA